MTINKIFGQILQLLSCHIFKKYFDRAYLDFNWFYSLTFIKFQTKYALVACTYQPELSAKY